MRTVLTVSIDTYDERGVLTGSLLGMRASSALHDPHDVLEHIATSMPETWRQMSYQDIVTAREQHSPIDAAGWAQLSIF